MPINASIISNGFDRIQPPDVAGSIGRILTLRGLEQRQQANDLELQQEQRKAARQQQLEQLAAQYGGDPDRFLKEYRKIDPVGAAELEKKYADSRKSGYEAYNSQLASETKELEAATRELQSIAPGDIPSFAGWRSKWTARNPELDRLLPPPDQFTPDVQARLLTLGQSSTDFLKAKAEGVKAFLAGDYRKGLGGALAVAPSLEIAKQTIEEAKKAIPAGAQGDIALFEGLLAQANGDLNAFRQAAGAASLTEKERQDLANAEKDNARADKALENTIKTDAEQLRISRGNLSVAQENLKLRKQESGAGGGPLTQGDTEMVSAIMANPAIYQGLTPTAKTKLAVPLAKAGFTGWEKGKDGKTGPDVDKIMNEIDALAKRIFTQGPLMANVAGAVRSGLSKANFDNDVAEYNALIDSMIPMVARAEGHTGVLTQQDVDSTRSGFPKISILGGTDNAQLAANKMARIRRLIGTGAAAPTDKAPAPTEKKNPFRK